MTEAKALRELWRGSETALEWFIDKYTPYVSTVICNIVGGVMDLSDVEEVTSDVFLAFWSNAHKVRSSSARSYLGSIARNRAKNKLRERGHDLSLEDDFLITEARTPETQLEEQELRDQVRRAVLAMEQPDREIFLRHYYYCQPLATISEEMEIKLSTVKTRLHRGREKLRDELKEDTVKEAVK